MSDDDRAARQMLAFFGAITASLSHEMKNALATINEYSGLLDDLVQAANHGRPLSPERLEKVCSKISKQVQRNEALIGRLNRFAHCTDDPRCTVVLTELLELFCNLCDRFAMLAQVTLDRRFVDPSPMLTGDPFALLHALFLCLDSSIAAATAGDTITLSTSADSTGCVISIEGQRPVSPPADERRQLLEALLHGFGGQLRWPTSDQPARMDVAFPSGPIAGRITESETQEPSR